VVAPIQPRTLREYILEIYALQTEMRTQLEALSGELQRQNGRISALEEKTQDLDRFRSRLLGVASAITAGGAVGALLGHVLRGWLS
jgi:hypothetical protein